MSFGTYAKFRGGNPIMRDYTPGADVLGGDVVVIVSTIVVIHTDILSGVKGAAACGGGIYEMPKTAGGSTAIPDGTVVYWDATNHVITTSAASGTNKRFGTTVGASVDADTTQRVLHTPN